MSQSGLRKAGGFGTMEGLEQSRPTRHTGDTTMPTAYRLTTDSPDETPVDYDTLAQAQTSAQETHNEWYDGAEQLEWEAPQADQPQLLLQAHCAGGNGWWGIEAVEVEDDDLDELAQEQCNTVTLVTLSRDLSVTAWADEDQAYEHARALANEHGYELDELEVETLVINE